MLESVLLATGSALHLNHELSIAERRLIETDLRRAPLSWTTFPATVRGRTIHDLEPVSLPRRLLAIRYGRPVDEVIMYSDGRVRIVARSFAAGWYASLVVSRLRVLSPELSRALVPCLFTSTAYDCGDDLDALHRIWEDVQEVDFCRGLPPRLARLIVAVGRTLYSDLERQPPPDLDWRELTLCTGILSTDPIDRLCANIVTVVRSYRPSSPSRLDVSHDSQVEDG